MAKGNAFNGMLRGRIGDTVFSRKNGAQHSRAYVQEIANPKTTSQSGQRVKFGTLAAFYASAVQNLFKFAFEGKKTGESDYNAFMRLNLGHCPPQTKFGYTNGAPCVGPWIMSHGSLATPFVDYAESDIKAAHASLWTGAAFSSAKIPSVGELSKSLEDMYGYQDGDIVTIVVINTTTACAEQIDDAYRYRALTAVPGTNTARWIVRQFILDSQSSLPADRLGIFQFTQTPTNYLLILDADKAEENVAAAACVVVSRNTKRGLKVSTSRLIGNKYTDEAIAIGQTEAWWQYAADEFGKSYSLDNIPQNILQGSIAANAVGDGIETSVPLPITKTETESAPPGKAVTTLMVTLAAEELNRLVFIVNGLPLPYIATTKVGEVSYRIYSYTGAAFAVYYEPENQDVYLWNESGPVTLEKIYLI